MKIGVIILARANFGRWPDKVLFKLEGKTILEHVIRKSKMLHTDEVIVSTTENQEDQIIRKIALSSGINISLGDPDDRTTRHSKAIEEYNLDYFINISPAVPFFDVDLTNRLISASIDNPGYDHYRLGGHTKSFIPWISNASLVSKRLKQKDRDQEIFIDPDSRTKYFALYNWHDPEVKNKFLFDGNIAYKIQADNHRRICEYLGHFPKNYDEVVKALMGIQV